MFCAVSSNYLDDANKPLNLRLKVFMPTLNFTSKMKVHIHIVGLSDYILETF
jgi:hypothetical protein